MTSNKKMWGALIVVAIIAITGLVFPTATNTVVTKVLGGNAGFDFLNPFANFNGVVHEYRQAKLNTATTTPCAFLSPSSTSTLVHAALRVGTATSTATTWTFAKATSPYATTTELGRYSLSSGAFGTMVASSTQLSGVTVGVDTPNVIAPSTYLVWGVAGVINAAIPSINFGGVCSAEFITI